MNSLILGYVRVTCYAALYCMGILVGANLHGNVLDEARTYHDSLIDIVNKLNEEADSLASSEVST